ncbi:MAG: hypothetical protein COS94_09440 [Candidatus Hydrogenedentes bacterium CG07_land_8_20_14_0_80_42_17]|nr:MAG: hypothetical protein COS94_09440 [Candidatus Hydrogenedentes bacterium CG07_land_8_20_14_0_80_42_17]
MPSFDIIAGGILIRIESDRGGDPIEALRRDWSAMIMNDKLRTPDIYIKIHTRNWNEPSPIFLPRDARLIRLGGRKVFTDGKRFFVDYHENAFFIIEDNFAEGVCYVQKDLDPLFWTELSVNQILLLLLRRRNRFFIHGGGAINSKGTACIFIGSGGSGKSTSALALLHAGWPFMGDDILLFDSNFRFYSFLKRPSASDWTVEKLGLQRLVIGSRTNGKKLIAIKNKASCSDSFRIFRPLPSISKNEIRPMNISDIEEIIRSQTRLCDTDEIIAGALPDLKPLYEKCSEIIVGSLETLSEFLSKI